MDFNQDEWADLLGPYPGRVHAGDGEILLDTTETPGGYQYPIDLVYCRTHSQTLHWIAHLCEKDWVTTEMILDFILLLEPGVYEINI